VGTPDVRLSFLCDALNGLLKRWAGYTSLHIDSSRRTSIRNRDTVVAHRTRRVGIVMVELDSSRHETA
jgi:hypothetical protein